MKEKEFVDDFSKIDSEPQNIFTRSAYKNYIETYTVNNRNNVLGFDGLQLCNVFKNSLQKMIAEHGAIKYYIVCRCEMEKRLDDEVIETTDDFYVSATKHELYTDDDIISIEASLISSLISSV